MSLVLNNRALKSKIVEKWETCKQIQDKSEATHFLKWLVFTFSGNKLSQEG